MKLTKRKLRSIIRETLVEVSLGLSFNQIEYTGFILDDKSHKALADLAPDGWEIKAHHMTIIGPADQKYRLPSKWIDFSGCFQVNGIAVNDFVMTARVDLGSHPIPMKGPSFPHVTIAVNPVTGGKAMQSNEFNSADFKAIQPITICGHVEEILK